METEKDHKKTDASNSLYQRYLNRGAGDTFTKESIEAVLSSLAQKNDMSIGEYRTYVRTTGMVDNDIIVARSLVDILAEL
jgi:hypothetical protein